MIEDEMQELFERLAFRQDLRLTTINFLPGGDKPVITITIGVNIQDFIQHTIHIQALLLNLPYRAATGA